MKFPANMQRIYDAIARAAAAGERCPSNGELCDIVGVGSAGTTSVLVTRLERAGAIEVARGSASRVVTIVATGRRTAGRICKPHFTEQLDAEGRAALAATKSRAMKNSPHKRGPSTGGVNGIPLDRRIARDQAELARRRAQRDHWLAVEQQKYALPTRARPIEEMPI